MILAIDPGTSRSAWVEYLPNTKRVIEHRIEANEDVLDNLRFFGASGTVLIEKVESYGMPVGAEVFDTVMWVGRFIEALHPTPVILVPRRHVKLTVCLSPRANDASIRQALIDRFGGGYGKSLAIGSKPQPGPLYGIKGDEWQALAVAVAYSEAPL